MNKERDQFLTEAMGEVWHVIEEGFIKGFGDTFKCSCGLENYSARMCRKKNKTFSTPDGFFKLWKWANEQRWWENFWCNCLLWTSKCYRPDFRIREDFKFGFVNPDNFANALYNYLKEK
jgi:hypothetical protein